MTVDFVEGGTDKTSWLIIWEAAVAVNKMCVKSGKAGISFGLGESFCSSDLDGMLRSDRAEQDHDGFTRSITFHQCFWLEFRRVI